MSWGVPGTKMWQVFVVDPNGVDVEFLYIPRDEPFFDDVK